MWISNLSSVLSTETQKFSPVK